MGKGRFPVEPYSAASQWGIWWIDDDKIARGSAHEVDYSSLGLTQGNHIASQLDSGACDSMHCSYDGILTVSACDVGLTPQDSSWHMGIIYNCKNGNEPPGMPPHAACLQAQALRMALVPLTLRCPNLHGASLRAQYLHRV